ncbi:Protein phosphatase 1 regulatory subunit 1A [Chelonia mydas]|uniref:Protein phosphatase 1 regulatory subunit 1A n=1 Tax=Chelonia mydas TaxID=8469 RepID=M7ALE0_CHEMY|nr:Protein phosphatase 1 regulatory subunit 1A [Chelonia mydas]
MQAELVRCLAAQTQSRETWEQSERAGPDPDLSHAAANRQQVKLLQEIDEDRLPNPLLKPGLSMSPRQRKKVPRTTPTMKELQMMVEHHLCKQQGEEEDASVESQEPHSPGCCHHGNTAPSHSPGGTCPLAQAKARLESQEGNCAGPDRKEESTGACAKSEDNGRPGLSSEKQRVHTQPTDSSGKQAPASD